MSTELDTTEAVYRINAVANLTGISANTLRTWERRYGMPKPRRTEGGTRLYAEDDVTRLQLIAALRDHGESISTLVELPIDALRERLSAHQAGPISVAPSGTGRVTEARLAVLSPTLADQIAHADLAHTLPVHRVGTTLRRFLATPQPGPVDVLIADLALLGEQPVRELEHLAQLTGAPLVLVLVHYAPRDQLADLADAGARIVRQPVSVAELQQRIFDHLSVPAARRPAPPRLVEVPEIADDAPFQRRFDDDHLTMLLEAQSDIACACPNHLAQLTTQLAAFEDYSHTCANRSDDDAKLHAWLAAETARARAIVEEMLAKVCEMDRVELL